jgi:hypothetical protein
MADFRVPHRCAWHLQRPVYLSRHMLTLAVTAAPRTAASIRRAAGSGAYATSIAASFYTDQRACLISASREHGSL